MTTVELPLTSGRTRARPLWLLTGVAVLTDLVMLGAAVVPAAALQERAVVAAPVLAVAWIAAMAGLGAYRADVFGSSLEEYKRVLNATLVVAALVGVCCYVGDLPLSRHFFVLVFLVGGPALLGGRFVLRRVIHRARHRGDLLCRALVVGSTAHVDETAAALRRDKNSGFDVVGALTPTSFSQEETGTGLPVLGHVGDVARVARSLEVDTIIFAGGGVDSAQQMREAVWDLEHADVNVVVAPAVSEISGHRISIRPVAGLPLMHVEKPTWDKAVRAGKRVFDLASALVILALATPVLLWCAARVRLHDGGPVLFRQTRIGRDGAPFDCLKFRTMMVDAEARLTQLQLDVAFDGGLFKMKADPRITSPGRLLRRFSLDELPQLLNVVRGDMSLVGPRPPLPAEVQGYASSTARRLRVRPGMTGLWQVSGRSDLSFEEAVRLDLFYVDNWSMLQDLSILARTFSAVVSSRGAY